jgi:hypothetical protein
MARWTGWHVPAAGWASTYSYTTSMQQRQQPTLDSLESREPGLSTVIRVELLWNEQDAAGLSSFCDEHGAPADEHVRS